VTASGKPGFWVIAIFCAVLLSVAFLSGQILHFLAQDTPVVEVLRIPRFYGQLLEIDATHLSSSAGGSDYALKLVSRSPKRWAWSRPGTIPHREFKLRWWSYSPRQSTGEGRIDLERRMILHGGKAYPLDVPNLARVTDIDVSGTATRVELAIILNQLEEARLGTVKSSHHPRIFRIHNTLSMNVMAFPLSYAPLPDLVMTAFSAGVILVLLMCPKPWRRFRQRWWPHPNR